MFGENVLPTTNQPSSGNLVILYMNVCYIHRSVNRTFSHTRAFSGTHVFFKEAGPHTRVMDTQTNETKDGGTKIEEHSPLVTHFLPFNP